MPLTDLSGGLDFFKYIRVLIQYGTHADLLILYQVNLEYLFQ